MSCVPVAFSLMASFMSSITLLGVSSENYLYGTQFIMINLAYIVGTPIAAYLYLPVFYRLRNTSVYQVQPTSDESRSHSQPYFLDYSIWS